MNCSLKESILFYFQSVKKCPCGGKAKLQRGHSNCFYLVCGNFCGNTQDGVEKTVQECVAHWNNKIFQLERVVFEAHGEHGILYIEKQGVRYQSATSPDAISLKWAYVMGSQIISDGKKCFVTIHNLEKKI